MATQWIKRASKAQTACQTRLVPYARDNNWMRYPSTLPVQVITVPVDDGLVEEILSEVPYSRSWRVSHLYLLFEGKIPDFLILVGRWQHGKL